MTNEEWVAGFQLLMVSFVGHWSPDFLGLTASKLTTKIVFNTRSQWVHGIVEMAP
jgi:hypothetical protein